MKIKHITEEYFSGKVYNFSCEPDHNYFSEGVLVHNCDVPKVGPGRNATLNDLFDQVTTAMSLHPNVTSSHLNIHFARMGEPSFNPEVLTAAIYLRDIGGHTVHPVVSTMVPKTNIFFRRFIEKWVTIKNEHYKGNAGLQLSINSTSENERLRMFGGNCCTLEQISRLMDGLHPVGRKFALNFAVGPYTIDANELVRWFSPDDYMVKLTPMHETHTAKHSGLVDQESTRYEPYAAYENALKKVGYDVLVFLASEAEDKGRITCGNAILSGSKPFDM